MRETWVKDIKESNISIYFVIGLTSYSQEQYQLKREANENQDIIQIGFIENYFNTTLKTIAILRWAQNKCDKSKFIVKVDEDALVIADNLINLVKKLKDGELPCECFHLANIFSLGITGYISKIHKDMSDLDKKEGDKWFFPLAISKEIRVPMYVSGGGYIISRNAIPKLLEVIDSYEGFIIDIEDAMINGIIAERAGVPRYDNMKIRMYDCDVYCFFRDLAITYECFNDNEIISSWTKWKNYQVGKNG